jgi:arginine deiminase
MKELTNKRKRIINEYKIEILKLENLLLHSMDKIEADKKFLQNHPELKDEFTHQNEFIQIKRYKAQIKDHKTQIKELKLNQA